VIRSRDEAEAGVMSSADETLMEVMLNLHGEQRQTADPAHDTVPRRTKLPVSRGC
jgi:hypothetical protein